MFLQHAPNDSDVMQTAPPHVLQFDDLSEYKAVRTCTSLSMVACLHGRYQRPKAYPQIGNKVFTGLDALK